MTTTSSARAHAEPPTDRRGILLVFVGLMTAMLLSALDQTIFSTALPTIVGELDGVDHMLWVTTAYILAATIMMPVYGKLGDLIGRKSLFIIAISLFMVGSIVGGLSQGMTELIVGRAIQGLGGGGLMILSQAIIADIVPARERGRYMGVMGGVFALASVIGPLLGGWFTESVGWRWCMWINIPLGAIAILSAILFLHPNPQGRAKPRLDIAGMMLIAIASAALVLFTSWGGGQYDWDSPVILSLVAVTVIAGAAFVAVERRAAEPIMPLHMFRERNFVLTTGAGLLMGIAMFGTLAYMPTYLQMVAQVDATTAGLLMIPMMGAMLPTSIIVGRAVSRTGRYKWYPVAGSVIIAVAMYLLSTMTYTQPVWVTCLYLAVFGMGLGLQMQVLVLIVQNTFPLTMVGTATAANNYFRQIGASLGAAVVGSLFTNRLVALLSERVDGGGSALADANSLTPAAVQDLPQAAQDIIVSSYNDALTPVFLYIVPLALLSLTLLLFVKEAPLRTTLETRAPETEPEAVAV
ncbi:MDR family MFS transporter [Demequina sp. SYSU T00039]|uniref:MDR family MFS transporter n=1 Tax=Demequina lignilytica TaxID=3051663 RepID=A0AAW7M1M3_9MICO|nr:MULTISPECIES: MDR family MFS transporter [unclassified Demequina]MDN4477201.1 MDR family MFS transporter [Demequina sp. SYSU T00039-1]MDN4487374.1 MDR family MFS transporter [Demequina sp. SYSU T00039]